MKSSRRSRGRLARRRKRRMQSARSLARPKPQRGFEHGSCNASWVLSDLGLPVTRPVNTTAATAQMPVECFSNRLLKIGPRHGFLCQTLKQNLALVDEAGRTVAALEGEVLDKRLLQRRKFAFLGVAFHSADRLAVEVDGRDDAGRAGVAVTIGIIDDDRAAQALRGAATELGAGHAEILAQEIVHREFVAHVPRAVGASVDGDGERRHLSTPLIMAWVTGKDRKR